MSGMNAFTALQIQYGWAFLIFTVLAIWVGWQWLRGRTWPQTVLKLLLVFYASLVGWFYFSGILSPGCIWVLSRSFFWSQMLGRGLCFLWLVVALLWLLDAFLGRTRLAWPIGTLARSLFLAGMICALIYPIYELLGGRFYPQAQMFGAGPAPLILFSVSLLGGSRPTTWLGRLLLFLNACLSLDAGLASAICGQRWPSLLVLLAAAAAITYTLKNPRMVTLNRIR